MLHECDVGPRCAAGTELFSARLADKPEVM